MIDASWRFAGKSPQKEKMEDAEFVDESRWGMAFGAGRSMLEVKAWGYAIQVGKHFFVTFRRKLRIPDDGENHPLPPELGALPVRRVEDYEERVPESWREHGGVFISIDQREAMWLSFSGASWKPNAVKVAVGKVNAVSGEPWSQKLDGGEQDYVVVPDQPWIDGINSGDGFIRQFVCMPLGMGYTVEGQATGKEEFGGIQVIVYDPKPGKFPDKPPKVHYDAVDMDWDYETVEEWFDYGGTDAASDTECADAAPDDAYSADAAPGAAEMGLAVGGRMAQSIYPEVHGPEVWDEESFGRVYVHIVNSVMFREITGEEPPPTLVTAKIDAQVGLPWVDLRDEGKGDLEASGTLSKVKSVKEMDEEKEFGPQQDGDAVEAPREQIQKLGKAPYRGPGEIKDGSW